MPRGIRRVLVFAERVMPIQNRECTSKWVGPGPNGSVHSHWLCAFPLARSILNAGSILNGSEHSEWFMHSRTGLSISWMVYAFLTSAVTQICSRRPSVSRQGDRVPTRTPPARPPWAQVKMGAHKTWQSAASAASAAACAHVTVTRPCAHKNWVLETLPRL